MRKTCIACGCALPEEPLMTLDHMPSSAQNIPDESTVAEDSGITLRLCQCPACGLVQFDCDPVDYYRDVIRAGGFSTTMVNLRRSQYEHLISTYHLEGKRFLEAGCGRGEFLSVLREFPVEAWGIEHREDLVETAVKDGLNVKRGFTETEDTVLPGAPYDVFLSFNFLEHQPEPGVMLRCIRRNLREGGMGLITVPSLEYILQYDGYYELIRDHIAYYTFETLEKLLNSCGFEVLEREMVNRDTLSFVVKKRPLTDVSNLMEGFEEVGREMEAYLKYLSAWKKRVAIWGASHQGFTLAATTRLGDKVEYMIDSAPFKQGKYAPASHLSIVAPDHFFEKPVDAILIVAPGYTEEIAGIIREKFGSSVEILALKSDHLETL